MSKLKITLFLILSGLIFPAFGSALVEPTFAINIYDFFQRIFRILLTISIPLAVIVIIWAAFIFLTSGGEPEKTGRAKKVLIYGLIGFIIILFANGIVAVLGNILGVKMVVLEKQIEQGSPTQKTEYGILPAIGKGIQPPAKGEELPPPPPWIESFLFPKKVLAAEEVGEELPPPPEGKFIEVISPPKGTKIKRGEVYSIRWKASGIDKVGIVLYQGKKVKGVIARNLPATGYNDPYSIFFWEIPRDFETGDNFAIAIYEYSWKAGLSYAYSEGRFSILGDKDYVEVIKKECPQFETSEEAKRECLEKDGTWMALEIDSQGCPLPPYCILLQKGEGNIILPIFAINLKNGKCQEFKSEKKVPVNWQIVTSCDKGFLERLFPWLGPKKVKPVIGKPMVGSTLCPPPAYCASFMPIGALSSALYHTAGGWAVGGVGGGVVGGAGAGAVGGVGGGVVGGAGAGCCIMPDELMGWCIYGPLFPPGSPIRGPR